MSSSKLALPALLAAGAFLALAGCTSPSASLPDLPLPSIEQQVAALPALGYSGCVELFGAFPMPVELFATSVPTGWELATDDSGTVTDLLVYTDDCRGAKTGNTTVGHAAEMWGMVPVNPPKEYMSDAIDGYLAILGGMFSDETVAAQYKAWGVNASVAQAGDLTLTAVREGLARPGITHGIVDGFEIRMTVASAGMTYTTGPFAQRAFIVEDGKATGAIDTTYGVFNGLDYGTSVLELYNDPYVPLPVQGYPGFGTQFWGFGMETRYVPADLLTTGPAVTGNSDTSARVHHLVALS